MSSHPGVAGAWCAGVALAGVVTGIANAQDRIWYAESTTTGDFFGGTSIGPDLDGDGKPELLVTAPGTTCTNPNDGLARIYSTTSGQIQQWCGTGGWRFGPTAVWIDDVDGGGVDDVVLGESDYYDPVMWGRATGRFQVISVETGLVIYEVVGTQQDGHFGVQKALVGDYDADGVRDLLIGADSYGVNSEGRAWIYSMRTGSLIRTHYGQQPYWQLGQVVQALRDVDGDGITDYAIYADYTFALGRLQVYSGATGKALLKINGTGGGDHFGYAIGAPGDLDGDGIADVIVGGKYPDGHVDAYSAVSGKKIWRINGAASTDEWLGFNVFCLSDLNGDGYDELLATAANDDRDGFAAGRVDLISGRSHRPLYRFYSGLVGITYYGSILNGGADFNGDGVEDLIIGTANGGRNQAEGGHVAIYAGNDLWLQADPIEPDSTSTVTIDLRGAEPGRLGLVALVTIDGVPLFEPLVIAPFDANGELQLLADTDPSLSGHTFTLLGYAEHRLGRGPLMVSSPQTVAVQ